MNLRSSAHGAWFIGSWSCLHRLMNQGSSAHAHRFIYINKWASGSNIVNPVFSNVTVNNTFTDVVSPVSWLKFQPWYLLTCISRCFASIAEREQTRLGQSGQGQNGHFHFRIRSFCSLYINNKLFIYSDGFWQPENRFWPFWPWPLWPMTAEGKI